MQRRGLVSLVVVTFGVWGAFPTPAQLLDPVGPEAPRGAVEPEALEHEGLPRGVLAPPPVVRDPRPAPVRGGPAPTDTDGHAASGGVPEKVDPAPRVDSAIPEWDRRIALLRAAALRDPQAATMREVADELGRLRVEARRALREGNRDAFSKALARMDAAYARVDGEKLEERAR